MSNRRKREAMRAFKQQNRHQSKWRRFKRAFMRGWTGLSPDGSPAPVPYSGQL